MKHTRNTLCLLLAALLMLTLAACGSKTEAPAPTQTTQAPAVEQVTYTVTYTDQEGKPVPGVLCQICDEFTCQVFQSDDQGVCTFTLPPLAYEIHTLKIPEGYEGDTDAVLQASVQGGDIAITLTKK